MRPTPSIARIVIVTADHGESLGEHGEMTHGLFAYDATLAVPLILAGPSIGPGVVDAPVSHVDIVPTVLDLLGLGVPAGLDGQSLVHQPARERALYFEALDANLTRGWAPLTGVIRDGWKYIDLPIPELYDLAGGRGRDAATSRIGIARGSIRWPRRSRSITSAAARPRRRVRWTPTPPRGCARSGTPAASPRRVRSRSPTRTIRSGWSS